VVIVELRDVRHFIVLYEKLTPPHCAVVVDSATPVGDATTEQSHRRRKLNIVFNSVQKHNQDRHKLKNYLTRY
jgi:hypothetical protein